MRPGRPSWISAAAASFRASITRIRCILSFAHSCFRRALDMKQDLWFSAKDTISKTYDHRFKDIFAEVYEADYKRAV